ncbi:MAG: D-alanyl-D-alanine carboxypeptidase [Myxococcota bacterium]
MGDLDERKWIVGVVLAALSGCQPDPGSASDSTGTGSSSDSGLAATDPVLGTTDTTAGLDDTSSDSSGGLPPDNGDPFDPPPPVDPLPDDRLDALQLAIDGWLEDPAVASATHGLLLIDPAADQVLYERNPDTPLAPASNTKLFSTAAALGTLGLDHRMRTEVFGPAIDPEGVLNGDLDVIGHHDLSSSSEFFPGNASLPFDELARRLYDAGLREVTGDIEARGEFVVGGNSLGVYSATTERGQASTAFRDALLDEGIFFSGSLGSSSNFDPSPGTTLLAHWDTAPMSVVAVPTNVASHNEFADILLRHMGWTLGGDSSYPAGASELNAWLGSLGIDPGVFEDGSGLSHGNDVSPRQVIDLLLAMADLPEGLAWRRSFSIAGVRGTLSGRMLDPDTQGRVHGKTGTLTGVIATSGIVYNRWDGREYLFSILMNDTGVASATRAVHDGIITELARDLRGGLSPLPAPVLRHVMHEPGTDIARIEWSAVEGAEGYLVWLSPDGQVWSRADARFVTTTEHRAGALPFDAPQLHVRVTAVGPGIESDPSDTYATSMQDAPFQVLLIDGNDRWQAEPQVENPLGRGHDGLAVHARALDGLDVAFESATNEAAVDGLVLLADYDLVVWSLGEESTVHDTFTPDEQLLVRDHVQAGGALFASGAEIGWDLVDQGEPADEVFLAEVFGVQYVADDAQTFLVQPEGDWEVLEPWRFFSPGTMVVGFPDVFAPLPNAQALASYRGGTEGAALVRHDAAAPVVLLGLPFETLDHGPARAALLQEIVALVP